MNAIYITIHTCIVVVLQVDVLETQYTALVEKIRSTHDFETVKNAHSDFLGTLQSQLFFSLEPVSDKVYVMVNVQVARCYRIYPRLFTILQQGQSRGGIQYHRDTLN